VPGGQHLPVEPFRLVDPAGAEAEGGEVGHGRRGLVGIAGVDDPAEGGLRLLVAALHGQQARQVEPHPVGGRRVGGLGRAQEPLGLGELAPLHEQEGQVQGGGRPGPLTAVFIQP
jgi:hypothetical protein